MLPKGMHFFNTSLWTNPRERLVRASGQLQQWHINIKASVAKMLQGDNGSDVVVHAGLERPQAPGAPSHWGGPSGPTTSTFLEVLPLGSKVLTFVQDTRSCLTCGEALDGIRKMHVTIISRKCTSLT